MARSKKNPAPVVNDEISYIQSLVWSELVAQNQLDLVQWADDHPDLFRKLVEDQYEHFVKVSVQRKMTEEPRPDKPITPLYGHDSYNNAYVTPSQWGHFGKRQSRRDWIDHDPDYGYRWAYQTRTEGTARWDPPRYSRWARFAANLYLDKKGNVQWMGLDFHATPKEFLEFINFFPGLYASQRKALKKVVETEKTELKKILLLNEAGESRWRKDGRSQPVQPGEVSRNEAEHQAWVQVEERLSALDANR
jgi:hypothetical protein